MRPYVTRKHLNILYKQCNCKVVECDEQKLRELVRVDGSAGCYDRRTETIYILKSLPNYQKLQVVIHELQHFKCWSTGCKCSFHYASGRKYLAEYHAVKSELLHYVKNKQYSMFNAFFDGIKNIDKKIFPEHNIAFKMIKKTKMYKKCLRMSKKVTKACA